MTNTLDEVSDETQARYFCGLPEKSLGLELSAVDRRLLLASSLRLYLRRLSHNIGVTAGDLLRLLPYSDPPESGESLDAAA